MILEYETAGGEEEAALIYGPENLPIEQAFGSNAIYLHHDQQGSTRLVTYWQEGEVVGWKTYGPYGNILEDEGDATPLGYDGQPTDPETGLVWLGARRYDANTGQFMSIDPAVESTGEPYSYVGDDPENRYDSSGMCATAGKPTGGCLAAIASAIASLTALPNAVKTLIKDHEAGPTESILLTAAVNVSAACAETAIGAAFVSIQGKIREFVKNIRTSESELADAVAKWGQKLYEPALVEGAEAGGEALVAAGEGTVITAEIAVLTGLL
jgi:RHS repeat-associated protein